MSTAVALRACERTNGAVIAVRHINTWAAGDVATQRIVVLC